jgi:hypothetical protein
VHDRDKWARLRAQPLVENPDLDAASELRRIGIELDDEIKAFRPCGFSIDG